MKLQQLSIPEPSKLYSLKPEGLGTPEVESLASYTMRLAEAHCLDVCNLIHLFVHPLIKNEWKDTHAKGFNKFHKVYRHTVTPAHLRAGKWLDMTKETEATVAALSKLTRRQELNLLTTLPLSSLVQQKTVLRYRRAWCPCCYDEQKDLRKPIYDLLLWSFKDVVTCHKHDQILWSCCTWCAAKQYPLSHISQPGHCITCGGWLGKNRKHFARATYLDKWKAQALGELVADFDNLPTQRPRRRPTIQKLLHKSFRSNVSMKDLLSRIA